MVVLDAAAWRMAVSIAAAVGLTLKALWFHPWLSLGIALDLGVLAAVLGGWPSGL
jgi:hypothetical protein